MPDDRDATLELETGSSPRPGTATPDEDKRLILGRYEAQEILGRGGMGVVYRAFDPQLQRHVAAKVVRREVLSDEAEARLLREARAMAQIDHPNVVKVFDVTPCDAGWVVAMELVPGVDLRRWLALYDAPWRGVVEVFIAAGHGLAAVHDAGLTHRDFKPANVLLAEDGRVLVTDFGLALGSAQRVTGPSEPSEPSSRSPSPVSTESEPIGLRPRPVRPSDSAWDVHRDHLAVTTTGQVLGTLAYMSPEQIAGAPARPAGDQFAFCVALWEGLCGERPFVRGAQRSVSEAPRWPEPAGVAPAIGRVLRRGLSPSPEARFGSMASLLVALEHAAAPRRRRWPVVASMGVLMAGAMGWAVSGSAPGVQREPSRVDAVRDFEALGGVVDRDIRRVAESLDRGEQLLEAADLDRAVGLLEPAVIRAASSGDLRLSIRALALRGRARQAIGASESAREDFERALDLAVEAQADDTACGVATTLAVVLAVDLEQTSAALRVARHAVALARRTDPDGNAEGRARAALGTAYLHASELDPAQAELRRALELLELGEDARAAGSARNMLAQVLSARGAFDEATTLLEQVIDAEPTVLPSRHPLRATAMHNLGVHHLMRGDLDRAEPILVRAHEIRVAVLGPDHRAVADSLCAIGDVYGQRRQWSEAERHHRRCLAIYEDRLGVDHPRVALALNGVARDLTGAGRYGDAVALMRRSLELRLAEYGPDDPRVGLVQGNLANTLGLAEHWDEAARHRDEALRISEASRGPASFEFAMALLIAAQQERRSGALDDAARHIEQAAAIMAHHDRATNRADVAFELGQVRKAQDRDDEALAAFEDSLRLRREVYGDDNVQVLYARREVADLLHARGDVDQARPHYLAAWTIAQGINALSDEDRAHLKTMASRDG